MCVYMYVYDILQAEGGHILEDVRSSLEMEALHVDEMMSNLNAGSRLVQEKEQKLNLLHNLNKEVSYKVILVNL